MSKFNLNNYKSFVLFDTETEGLNLFSSRPWEIAWIHFNHKEILSKHQMYVKWDDLNISEEAKKITGFDEADYRKNAVDPLKVWKEFSKLYLDESVGIVGHNILGFDFSMVNNLCRHVKVFYPWKTTLERYIDTNVISKALKLNMEIDKNNFLSWQYKINTIRAKVKTNLKLVCSENDIEWDDSKSHRGLYDCEKNVEYFNKFLKYKLN